MSATVTISPNFSVISIEFPSLPNVPIKCYRGQKFAKKAGNVPLRPNTKNGNIST